MAKFSIVINLEVPDMDAANYLAKCALESVTCEDSAGVCDMFVEPGNKEPDLSEDGEDQEYEPNNFSDE
jgi:hypothetical protein